MKTLPVAATLWLLATAASAHVVLDQPSAPAGSAYRAALRIGHGCDGRPTHTVSVRLPEGVRGAKPQPKPGWTLTIRKAPLAWPYDNHGVEVREDVAEITWTAATRDAWLDDAHFDEFVLRAQLPAQPGPLWFAVRQQCEQGQWDWSEVPAQGTSTRGLKAPAVLLEVLPAAAGGHQH